MARLKKVKKLKSWSPNGYIKSALRRIWRWSPERREALSKSRISKGQYACASCLKSYDKKDVAIDHVDPVVDPRKGFEGWDVYICRLYCPARNLQALCRACHSIKSKEENALRRKCKKEQMK